MRILKALLILGFLVVTGLLLSGWSQKTKIYSRSYGPQSVIRYARPTIRWEVWPDGDSKITQVALVVNGKEVQAIYDSTEKAVLWDAPAPLSGKVEVQAVLTVDNRAQFTKKWNFEIAPAAVDSPPVPNKIQQALLDQISGFRKKLGLSAAQFDPRLLLAADQHANYLQVNALKTHSQTPETPQFLAATPMERVQCFGWVQGIWEALGFDFPVPANGVQTVFDAPYHRTSFMQPGPCVLGIAATAKVVCILGQVTFVESTVVSPADKETDVKVDWGNPEKPDPLRIWADARRPVGYPIVFHRFDSKAKKLLDVRATLTCDGKDVPFFLNSPTNDEFCQTTVILLPRDPMEKGKTYQVFVSAVDDLGQKLEKSWSFTTAK